MVCEFPSRISLLAGANNASKAPSPTPWPIGGTDFFGATQTDQIPMGADGRTAGDRGVMRGPCDPRRSRGVDHQLEAVADPCGLREMDDLLGAPDEAIDLCAARSRQRCAVDLDRTRKDLTI
jgi:hypothetical protein